MQREFSFSGRQVVINQPEDPHAATLTIDGTSIPLTWHEGFQGWGVIHTVYGHFPDLERLAKHMIIGNPRLRIGHGGGHIGDEH